VDPFAAKQVLRPPFDTRQYRRLLRRSYCQPGEMRIFRQLFGYSARRCAGGFGCSREASRAHGADAEVRLRAASRRSILRALDGGFNSK
jgi:hypothetical protein